MPTRAVNAHYLIDYRHQSVAFDSIPEAFEFLRREALRPGVLIDKIALEGGTILLSRAEMAQLSRDVVPARPQRTWDAWRAFATSKLKARPIAITGLARVAAR